MSVICPSIRHHSRNRPGFTLVELLSVIVIVTLLMLAGVPLLSDSSTNGRQTSREILRAHLQQARGHAIASGRTTSVIIASHDAATPRSGGLITIAEVEALPAGTTPFKVTRQVNRWSILPENIFFLSRNVTKSPRETLMDTPAIIDAEYQKKPVTCHAVIFSPDGRITHPADGGPLALAIGKGKDSSGGIIATQKSGDKVVFDFLRINRLNARARLIDPRTAP